jgi:hypothetical protein
MKLVFFIQLIMTAMVCVGQSGRQLKAINREIEDGNVIMEIVSLGENMPDEIKAIVRELEIFKKVDFSPVFKSLKYDCRNYQDVSEYFNNALRTKFFAIKRPNSDVSILESAVISTIALDNLSDEEKMERFNNQMNNELVDYILAQAKKKKKSTIKVIIPFVKTDELNSYLQDGWSIDKPKKQANLDSVQTINCSNSKIWIYKKKPCKDLEDAKIDLSETSIYEPSEEFAGATVIYPPKKKIGTGSSSEYILKGVNVCCERVRLNFMDTGGRVLKSEEFVPDDYLESGYWNYNLPINADDRGNGLLFWGDFFELYEISMNCFTDNEWSDEIDFGKFTFSKCSK